MSFAVGEEFWSSWSLGNKGSMSEEFTDEPNGQSDITWVRYFPIRSNRANLSQVFRISVEKL
jgi:hypothetical protein